MKKALIVSVAINLLVLLGFGGKRLYYHYSSSSSQLTYADQMNYDKNFILQHLPINKGDIVFVGNSITERFPMNEMFGSVKIKNRGIGGNLSKHVLERIGAIAKAQPAKIFIEVGINDLANNVPEQQIMINFRNIVDTIRVYSPSTQVYIQSIMPTTGADYKLMPSIISLNDALKPFCVATEVTLVDTYSPFNAGQRMNDRLTTDGTHLNYEGYKLYMQVLSRYIETH